MLVLSQFIFIFQYIIYLFVQSQQNDTYQCLKPEFNTVLEFNANKEPVRFYKSSYRINEVHSRTKYSTRFCGIFGRGIVIIEKLYRTIVLGNVSSHQTSSRPVVLPLPNHPFPKKA